MDGLDVLESLAERMSLANVDGDGIVAFVPVPADTVLDLIQVVRAAERFRRQRDGDDPQPQPGALVALRDALAALARKLDGPPEEKP